MTIPSSVGATVTSKREVFFDYKHISRSRRVVILVALCPRPWRRGL